MGAAPPATTSTSSPTPTSPPPCRRTGPRTRQRHNPHLCPHLWTALPTPAGPLELASGDVSNPQYVTVMTPWGFFPVSDVYSVVPKWEESHAVTADVIYDDDATNYYALVADLEATETSFVITMMDTTDPDNPVPPATTATAVSTIWQLEGWQ